MRPPYAYYGGKVGLARAIVPMLPAHRVYVEPFFGSGAVLFAKRPSPVEIANDVDLNVWTFFKVLRERREDLEEACRLTPYHRCEFLDADLVEPGLDDLERARRFWVRVNQSFAKTAGSQTGYSITTVRNASSSRSVWSRIGRFAPAVERLQLVTWDRADAVELIGRLNLGPDALLYVDPPYLAATRRGRGPRQRTADYLHDMGLPEDHERLAEALLATRATVVLSGYRSPLYDSLYREWPRLDFATKAHTSNAQTAGGPRNDRTESVWSNVPLGAGRLFA